VSGAIDDIEQRGVTPCSSIPLSPSSSHSATDRDAPRAPHPPPLAPLAAVVKYLLLFLIGWQARNRISATAMSQLLVCLGRVLRCTLVLPAEARSMKLEKSLSIVYGWQPKKHKPKWPKDITTAMPQLGINVEAMTRYAICPDVECGAVYTLDDAQKLIKCRRFVEVSTEQSPAIIAEMNEEREKYVADHYNSQACVDAREGGYALNPKYEGHASTSIKKVHDEITERCGRILLRKVDRSAADTAARAAETTLLAERKGGIAKGPGANLAGINLTPNPALMMPYAGILRGLKLLLQRPGFEAECEKWRRGFKTDPGVPTSMRRKETKLMSDVWDGEQWTNYFFLNSRTGKPWGSTNPRRNFPCEYPVPLLAEDGTLVLSWNIDWLQPFKSMTHSMGACYITVQNLPREERYKVENVIVVALLPGPSGTSRQQLQGVLRLMVAELKELLVGVACESAEHSALGSKRLRAFLLNIVCDTPAARQTAGFMSHAATVNCAYCTNCSARSNSLEDTGMPGTWDMRTDETQRHRAAQWATLFQKNTNSYEWRCLELDGPEELDIDPIVAATRAVAAARDAVLADALADSEPESEEDVEDHQGDGDADADEVDEARPRAACGTSRRAIARRKASHAGEMMPDAEESEEESKEESKEESEEESKEEAPDRSDARSARPAKSAWQPRHRPPKLGPDGEPTPLRKSARQAAADDAAESDDEPDADEAAAAPPAAVPLLPKKKKKRGGDAQAAHEKRFGARYSALLELDYFDIVRGTSIDVMHNVFLGTVKCLMVLLTKGHTSKTKRHALDERGVPRFDARDRPIIITETDVRPRVVSPGDLEKLQAFMTEMQPPSDIGRLPSKIASKFANFKAEQWKVWITIFAVPALRSVRGEYSATRKEKVLTLEHLDMMMTMREAALLMQSYTIDGDQIVKFGRLMIKLIQDVETLYGPKAVRPNMHFALHLVEHLRLYGPPAGYSCNAYERYNSLISNVPYNPGYIELCVMRRWILNNRIGWLVHACAMSLAPDGPDHAASPVPTQADYAFVTAILSGSINAETDALVRTVGLLEQRVRTTASGRTQHVYTWTGDHRQAAFLDFVRMRDRRIGRMYPEVNGNIPHIVGCEPMPGVLLDRKRFDQGEHRKGLNAFTTVLDQSNWPTELAAVAAKASCTKTGVGAKHIFNILRGHFALAYLHEIIGGPIATTPFRDDVTYGASRKRKHAAAEPAARAPIVTNMTIEKFMDLALNPKLDYLERVYAATFPFARDHTIDPSSDPPIDRSRTTFAKHPIRVTVFTRLMLGGEVYGCALSKRTVRSSFVAVRPQVDIATNPNPYLYGQILYFLTVHAHGRLHKFAVISYYSYAESDFFVETKEKEGDPERLKEVLNFNKRMEAEYPIVMRQHERLSRYNVVPVHAICFRWTGGAISWSDAYMQLCPIPSRIHA
jgi:hypothetical protein